MTLNESQKAAAEFTGKHLLVIAGAGTGKTKTIVARAEFLLASGVLPGNLAILSFTRKSAREIAERLKATVSANIPKSSLSGKTFHSWCNEIMHYYPDHFPHHSYTPLDEDDRISAMSLAIGRNFRDSMNEKINSELVLAIYSYALNTLCSLSESIRIIRYNNSDRNDETVQRMIEQDKLLLTPVIKKFIEFKKQRRYIDYDDMLNVVAEVLQNNEQLRREVNTRFKHILIDEMQDTNPLQYKLLKSFVDHSQLFCVGDDAQSIYAFRGADFKTIHAFTDVIPNSQKQKLTLNYRSTQEILDLSNWVLETSPLDYDKKLIAHRGSGNKPNLIHIQDDWEEADVITDEIVQHAAEGEKYNEHLVLSRSGFSLSKIEGACLTKKIPYVKLGGTSLMQSAHVRDVVSAMRIAANIYDELAWIRYLKLWEGIGDLKAASIITEIIVLETFEQMLERMRHVNIKGMSKEIPQALKNVREHVDNPSNAIRQAVQELEAILVKKYKDEWAYRAADFEVLQEVAKSTGNITGFITEYVIDPKVETTFKAGSEDRTDFVTLSTIHSAKGLEAKHVYLINANPHNFPSTRSIKQGSDAIEEERRCLYVALTRAKDYLNIYRFMKSLHTQSTDEKAQNLYFFNQLPTELVNIIVRGVEQKDFPKYDHSNQAEAEFPDFDFD